MERILYTTRFGSHLFGTATASSDTDIKHIVLPDPRRLLVGMPISNRVVKTNEKIGERNASHDVDVEFVPIQVFARDAHQGQAYALDLLFSVEGTHAGQTHFDEDGSPLPAGADSMFKRFCAELREGHLTRDITAMLGMAKNQAQIYSDKGGRLVAAREIAELFESAPADMRVGRAMEDAGFAERARELMERHGSDFVVEQLDVGAGKMAPHFVMLGEKAAPFTIKLGAARDMARAAAKRYGKRAEEAAAKRGDMKATMHALRIVDEAIDFLSKGRIELPTPKERAERLLAIRRGELDIDAIRTELEEKIARVGELEAASPMQPRDEASLERLEIWLEGWMMRFYGLEREASAKPRSARGAP